VEALEHCLLVPCCHVAKSVRWFPLIIPGFSLHGYHFARVPVVRRITYLSSSPEHVRVMQRAYLAKRLREVGIEVSWRGQPDNGGAEQVDSQAMIQTAEHRAAVTEALTSWRGAGCRPYHLSLHPVSQCLWPILECHWNAC